MLRMVSLSFLAGYRVGNTYYVETFCENMEKCMSHENRFLYSFFSLLHKTTALCRATYLLALFLPRCESVVARTFHAGKKENTRSFARRKKFPFYILWVSLEVFASAFISLSRRDRRSSSYKCVYRVALHVVFTTKRDARFSFKLT